VAAEGDRNTVTINEEIRRSPHLGDRLDVVPLDDGELAERRRKVDEARRRALEARLPVERGSVMPSLPAQLEVIDEPAAYVGYTFVYRVASWDVHPAPRAFLVGSWTPHEDGRVS
jgi:hypothetical protein